MTAITPLCPNTERTGYINKDTTIILKKRVVEFGADEVPEKEIREANGKEYSFNPDYQYTVKEDPEVARRAAAILTAAVSFNDDKNLVVDTGSDAYNAGLQQLNNQFTQARIDAAQRGEEISNVEVRYFGDDGVSHAMLFPLSDLPSLLEFKGAYDGSSTDVAPINDAQQSLVLLPFSGNSGVLRQTVENPMKKGSLNYVTNFIVYALSAAAEQGPKKVINPLDPGAAPIRVAAKLAQKEQVAFIGAETEFFLVDPETGDVAGKNTTLDGFEHNTYYAADSTEDPFLDFKADLAKELEIAGIRTDGPMHGEVRAGQVEVTRRFVSLEVAGIHENFYRAVVKSVAKRHGLDIDWGPFPMKEKKGEKAGNANGMHVNFSIQRKVGGSTEGMISNADDLGPDADPRERLTADGQNMIQGVMDHMKASTVVTNPDLGSDAANGNRKGSHDRLGQNEAPGEVAWVMPDGKGHSGRNRTATANVTLGKNADGTPDPRKTRIEARHPDPAQNTKKGDRTNSATDGEKYAAVVEMAIQGMEKENGEDLRPPCYDNLYKDHEVKEEDRLPKSMEASVAAYDADPYLHTGETPAIHPARMERILAKSRGAAVATH